MMYDATLRDRHGLPLKIITQMLPVYSIPSVLGALRVLSTANTRRMRVLTAKILPAPAVPDVCAISAVSNPKYLELQAVSTIQNPKILKKAGFDLLLKL